MGGFADAAGPSVAPSVDAFAVDPHQEAVMSERFDTIVIGAGQAGLSAATTCSSGGSGSSSWTPPDRVGGSWLNRWDSLTLFTPSIRDNLPGLPLGGGYHFPTKDAMVEYFERYVATFDLPVRLGVAVDGLFREGGGYRVTAGAEAFDANHVILATGVHRVPRTPSFAATCRTHITQLHSADYRNPGQLAPGAVLLVGAGQLGCRDRHGHLADPPGADGRPERGGDPHRHPGLAGTGG